MVLRLSDKDKWCFQCKIGTTETKLRTYSDGRTRTIYLWHNTGNGQVICHRCWLSRLEAIRLRRITN